MLRLADHLLGYQVDEAEKRFGRFPVIPKIKLTRVERVVAHYSHDIESLLYANAQALCDQRGNVGVEVFPFPPRCLHNR